MSVHLTTLKNLQIAIMEPRRSLTGGVETDEMKLRARDVIQQGNRLLILDLSKVTYINNTVLDTLLDIYNLYADKNGRVILCGMEKNVQNLFIITKLTGVFDIVENQKTALQILENPAINKSNET